MGAGMRSDRQGLAACHSPHSGWLSPVWWWPASSDKAILTTWQHATQRGMTCNLTSQAQARMIWPGVNGDITKTREGCMECWHIPPSQACMPLAEPSAPFQAMAADYFDIRGTHYLVVVDRLVHGPTLLRNLQKPVISSEHWWPISSHLGSVLRSALMVGQNLWLRRHRRFSAAGVLNTGCYWHCIFVSVIIFYENIVLRIVCLL